MAASGVQDVFVANEVVGAAAIERLVEVSRITRTAVAIDDPGTLERLGQRASEADATLGVVVELDVGMGRGGARTIDQALELGRLAIDRTGVELRGLMGYEGHCADEPDPDARDRATRASMAVLLEAAERFRRSGLPTDVVSAGSTGTYAIAGSIPGVTEVQAGSYALMDAYHAALAPEFSFALTVATTAISVHGDLVVFDAGRKATGGGFGPPAAPGGGVFAFIHEEHVGFRYPYGTPYRVGDRVRLVPDYAPTTVNLFGAFHVVEDGRVTDVWPVVGRHSDR
jgi:D-serine deaminase-like pyridoxal phosphate-dependent protein